MSKTQHGWNEDLPRFSAENLRRQNDSQVTTIVTTTVGRCRYSINASVSK